MKKLILTLSLLWSFPTLSAPIYDYVGFWDVTDGPLWSQQDQNGNYTTPIFSGVEAAAYIFGGSPDDYAISTLGSDPGSINFSAWMDGWGDWDTYALSGSPAPEDLRVDVNGDGLYALPFARGAAYSAYVNDHVSLLGKDEFINYAFRIRDHNVPEPSVLLLLGAGLISFRLFRKV